MRMHHEISQRQSFGTSVLRTLIALMAACGLISHGMSQEMFPEVSAKTRPKVDATLDELLQIYRQFNLPLPSKEAKLVWIGPEGAYAYHSEEGKEGGEIFYLGYREQDGTVWVGTRNVVPEREFQGKVVEIAPELNYARKVYWDAHAFEFEQNLPIAAAIQAHARGDRVFAQALLARGMVKRGIGPFTSPLSQPQEASAKERVAYLALTHFAGLLPKQDADRREIYENLRRVYASGLVRQETRLFGTVPLLESLRLSLRPIRGVPGTIERAVDELVYCSAAEGMLDLSKKDDPFVEAVKAYGLAAVPALARHVEDHRLTWSLFYGVNNAHTHLIEVKRIVRRILAQLSEGRLKAHENWNEKEILGWFRAKEAGQEADYFLKMAFRRPADTVYGYGPEAKTLPDEPDWRATGVLMDHFPEKLPAVLTVMARDWPGAYPNMAAAKLDASALPASTKRNTFTEIARNGTMQHQFHALTYLHKYDLQTFEQLLIPAVASIPLQLEPLRYFSFFNDIVEALILSSNSKIWNDLSGKLAAATPLMRSVVLSDFWRNGTWKQPKDFFPVIRFLVGFVNDPEMASPKEGESSMFTGFIERYSSLTSGKIALRSLASVPNLPISDDYRTGKGDWAALRERVKLELTARGLGFLASRVGKGS